MTQNNFMLFLRFWVRSIQALPNPVRWLPNSGILFLNPPNVCGKAKKRIHNPTNHIVKVILHLPDDSSPWFSKKNKVFQSKKISNLVLWDDFSFDGVIWLSYDSLFVSEEIWNLPPWWRTWINLLRIRSRSKENGYLLI